ncbi:MAG: hypothetical protein R8K20_09275 [Gallionellaceae bacterium]
MPSPSENIIDIETTRAITPPHPITAERIVLAIKRGVPVPVAISAEGIAIDQLTQMMAQAHRNPLLAAFFTVLSEAEARYLSRLAAQLNKPNCKDWRKIMAVLQVRDRNNWADGTTKSISAVEDKTYL